MPPYRTGSNPGSAMADVTLRVQLGASYIAPPRQQSSLPLASVNYPDRTIQALDYSPKFGLSGGMIRARVLYMRPVTHDICLRLVFGTRPVRTKCQNVGNVNYELSALIPELNCPMERVVVLVQALTITNEVLDTCALGTFTFKDTSDASAATLSRQRTEEDGYSGVDKATSQATVARYTNESACTSIDPSVVNMQTPVPPSDKAPSARRAQLRRGRSTSTSASSNSKVQSLMRTRPAAIAPCISKKAVLETLTSFDTMVEDWRDDEKEVGRRLIRFQVQRQEHILKVSCERIEQSEYDERDIVVSCIHRTESGICYITSVDIIYLLERIVGTVFKVEEKNRIRRNLEGLKPITTGKGKRWCQDFFQKIMSFPNPKPRTIEKDLKVFEWRVLGQALEKIISRYSLYSVPADTNLSQEHSPASGESDAGGQYLPNEYAFDAMQGPVYSTQESVGPVGIVPSAVNPSSYPSRSHSLSPTFTPDAALTTADLRFSGTSSEGSSTHSSPMMCNPSLDQGVPSNVAGGWVGDAPMHAYSMIHPSAFLSPHVLTEAYAVNPENLSSDGFAYRVFEDTFAATSCGSQYYM